MWHLEISQAIARSYAHAGGYENGVPFDGVATIKMLGEGSCFIEGALTRTGANLSYSDWHALGRVLRDTLGIRTVWAKRKGKIIPYDLQRYLKG